MRKSSTSWELEYISGPDINFNDYSNKKPTITFDKITKATGNNKGNAYAADYILIDDYIVGEPGPTTMMFCGEVKNIDDEKNQQM
jgi:heat shock protein HslJ